MLRDGAIHVSRFAVSRVQVWLRGAGETGKAVCYPLLRESGAWIGARGDATEEGLAGEVR